MFHLLLAIIYLSFISLGLPDGLLGAAWPSMYTGFAVPMSYAGIISVIICLGTIVSSLQSDRLTFKLGTGKVTQISVAMTAVALIGFSFSDSFWMLCLWAVPYGLGAGSVDASLNNYVALHYKSRHMSWLHCMWGVGATVGPYLMGFALSSGQTWNMGYRYVGMIQIVLTVILLCSLPLWRTRADAINEIDVTVNENEKEQKRATAKPLSLREIVRIPGAKEVMVAFFCYCAMETTAGLWASSYLVMHCGLTAEEAAGFASLFYLGVTLGRGASGFITMKLNDTQMIRLGEALVAAGIVVMLFPFGNVTAMMGLILIGLGCAPIYPCIIHSTPAHFGADKSQAIIGVQMASAYTGSLVMPPVFGLIANHMNAGLFPVFLLVIFVALFIMHERLVRTRAN